MGPWRNSGARCTTLRAEPFEALELELSYIWGRK
jgi:hypothetical protein